MLSMGKGRGWWMNAWVIVDRTTRRVGVACYRYGFGKATPMSYADNSGKMSILVEFGEKMNDVIIE